MELKKTIEKLWITKLLVEGLNKVFIYNEHLGCFLLLLFFLLLLPILPVLLPVLWLVSLFKK
ncbi:hypothetical protein CGC59_12230 [Capnocytophaga sputigena]|uniref:Uncharacterized protein n=1 Tax=Capnocytophaga sputigena TaxID=1019 RepID=A0A250F839_CAPSP|nr:hypothetical protein [Capnocytophaga sputigena]ATA80395.1 hypothetical protein CGC59_12230 [Capnocytophaga sputigena]